MFVAVLLPESVVEDLERFLEPRREAAAFRWTPPEHWHLTLAFAGDVPDRVYDDLVARLERAARKRTPMQARIVGGGAFPNAARARVLYAGVQTDTETDTGADTETGVETDTATDTRNGAHTGTEELRRTATGARAAFAKAGAEVEGHRFRPHITIARMGRPVEATSWVRLLDAYAGPQWLIDEVALVASYLGEGPRRRPRHEVLETFSLGPAGSGPERPSAPRRDR
jgi:2'-5' RNA ligase